MLKFWSEQRNKQTNPNTTAGPRGEAGGFPAARGRQGSGGRAALVAAGQALCGRSAEHPARAYFGKSDDFIAS